MLGVSEAMGEGWGNLPFDVWGLSQTPRRERLGEQGAANADESQGRRRCCLCGRRAPSHAPLEEA